MVNESVIDYESSSSSNSSSDIANMVNFECNSHAKISCEIPLLNLDFSESAIIPKDDQIRSE